MDGMGAPTTVHPGILHHINVRLKAFEHTPVAPISPSQPANSLFFLGGLGDDLLSPAYIYSHLVPLIQSHFQGTWQVIELQLSTSGQKWGLGSTLEDARELAQVILYFKDLRDGKIIVMGHSTGCQDIMSYYSQLPEGQDSSTRPHIDGVIFQAPVSDREAITLVLKHEDTAKELLTIADSLIESGKGKTLLPLEKTRFFFGDKTPISAERWFSLTAPLDEATKVPKGDEDFFSSDIPETYMSSFTWGKIPQDVGVLILYSGEDEAVPKEVDKEKLVNKWIKILKERGIKVDEKRSGVVEEANHNMSGVEESVMVDLLGRIRGFLEWVQGGCGREDRGYEGMPVPRVLRESGFDERGNPTYLL